MWVLSCAKVPQLPSADRLSALPGRKLPPGASQQISGKVCPNMICVYTMYIYIIYVILKAFRCCLIAFRCHVCSRATARNHVLANRTCHKYQSKPRVMVPLEPSSFVCFGQLFIQFLESSWRSTESSWCLARLQGVMVPGEPSSLRSDLVEPTKDDPDMQQRDTNSKLSIHLRNIFGNLIFCKTKFLKCGITILWQHDILAT